MAEKKHIAKTKSSPERDDEQDVDRGNGNNGREDDVAKYEQDLAGYLQDRIKPGLNRGSIPLLARSIAKEIARDEYVDRNSGESEPSDEDEGDDELSEDGDLDLETALRELQGELGEEWILYFCVQGENTWLVAEKDDATQRVEAPNASVLTNAVKVLNEGGGRSAASRSKA